MANDQKHLLVIARSARLRPTLFSYDPEAYEAWIKSGGPHWPTTAEPQLEGTTL
jgi:hypothetical protein